MTTGRINQVACRAARAAPIPEETSTTRSATDRATDPRETRAHSHAQFNGRITARATRTEPRWLQHVRAQCYNGFGSHTRPLSRESRRARRRNRRRRTPTERSAADRRTESPLRPAEHPLATRGAQQTETHATPDRVRTALARE